MEVKPRDRKRFAFTQKLIGKPYLKADVVYKMNLGMPVKQACRVYKLAFKPVMKSIKRSCHLLMSVMVMKKV